MRAAQVSRWLQWLLLAIAAHAASASAAGLQPFTSPDELRTYLIELNQTPEGIGTVSIGSCSVYPPLRDAAAAQGRRLSVQVSGELILILRAGRLFSVSLANDGLRVVDALAVGDFPDGMLLHGNRLFVVSDRVKRLLDVVSFDADGRLTLAGSYELGPRGYDLFGYQIVGTKLVATGSLYNFAGKSDVAMSVQERALPHLYPAGQPQVDTTSALQRVYRPVHRAAQATNGSQLLTQMSCDLSDPMTKSGLACETTVLPGIWQDTARAGSAVYLIGLDASGRSVLYRVPVDGSTPSAVQIRGTLVRDGLWEHAGFVNLVLKSAPEGVDATLLQLPLGAFGDGSQQADAKHYRKLPPLEARQIQILDQEPLLKPFEAGCEPPLGVFTKEGAFLGEARVPLELRGAVTKDRKPRLLSITPRGNGLATQVFALPPIDSVFSYDSYLTVNLSRHAGWPTVGLPILRFATEQPSASLAFASLGQRGLEELGSLEALMTVPCEGCDWRYRNAQPIFVGQRWFALLNDQLIEGALQKGRLRERRRIIFAR